MGRKSSLTPEQWLEVEKRHFIGGESINSLAKAFGVNESNIRRRISPKNAESKKGEKSLRDLALAKVAAEKKTHEIAEEIARLPISRQNIVSELARQLTNVSVSLASAAELNAKTAHRLSALANTEVQKIDDADPLAAVDKLKGVAVLTKMANDSATIGMNLLAANKETVKSINEAPPEDDGPDLSGLSDQAISELMALRLTNAAHR